MESDLNCILKNTILYIEPITTNMLSLSVSFSLHIVIASTPWSNTAYQVFVEITIEK